MHEEKIKMNKDTKNKVTLTFSGEVTTDHKYDIIVSSREICIKRILGNVKNLYIPHYEVGGMSNSQVYDIYRTLYEYNDNHLAFHIGESKDHNREQLIQMILKKIDFLEELRSSHIRTIYSAFCEYYRQ